MAPSTTSRPKAFFPNLPGFKAYPTPMWGPYKYVVGGAGITLFLVSQLQNIMVRLPENVENPENPYRKQIVAEQAAAAGHH